MLTEWAASQQSLLNDLTGCVIDDWRCIEMSFESADETQPIWRHPSVNAIQCAIVDAFIDNCWRRFHTSVGDDPASDWGLVVAHAPHQLDAIASGTTIYRNLTLKQLPTGLVESVVLATDSFGMVGRVDFRIADDCVSLAAGEVYDDGKGGFRIADYDESILLRLNDQTPRGG